MISGNLVKIADRLLDIVYGDGMTNLLVLYSFTIVLSSSLMNILRDVFFLLIFLFPLRWNISYIREQFWKERGEINVVCKMCFHFYVLLQGVDTHILVALIHLSLLVISSNQWWTHCTKTWYIQVGGENKGKSMLRDSANIS